MKHNKQKGFTLVELLVVISITGLLSAITMTLVSSARVNARDAKRLTDIRQIQNALELYYDDNNYYPAVTFASSGELPSGTEFYNAWKIDLTNELALYMDLPYDPLPDQINYIYFYRSTNQDNYQSYGLSCFLEHQGNYRVALNDGGFFPAFSIGDSSYGYELGEMPSYCVNKYGTSYEGNWAISANQKCFGGP